MLRISVSLTAPFGDSPMERLSMSSSISNGGKIILIINNFMAVLWLPLLFLRMNILTYIAISWFLVNFEPLQLLIDSIFRKIRYSNLAIYLHSSASCIKCVSFWLTLLCTWSFVQATIVALLSFILQECLQKLSK